MSLTLRGLGTAVPAGRITQEEGLEIARALGGPELQDAPWLHAIYANSGVNARNLVFGRPVIDDVLNGSNHSASLFLPNGSNGPTTAERMEVYKLEAPKLALHAASLALKQAGHSATSYTHLVTVSCTGFAAPGVDFALIRGLGLCPTIERTNVGFMGCHGALNGLRVANAYCKADSEALVLLCAVELSSIHYHYGWQPDRVVANALFADGAAAIVGSSIREPGQWSVDATGSCIIPNSEKMMSWHIGDHGFEMSLSRKIPDLIAAQLKPWLNSWLIANGTSINEIGSWAIHPGGPKILTAVEEGLQLRDDALAASRAILSECGNMSSPTVLFILERLRNAESPRPCVMLGFGPGLVAEAVLWR